MRKMTKAKLRKFRELYLKMRADIIRNLNSIDPELDLDGDDVDHVQGMALSEMSEKLSQRDLDRLNRLDAALQKIEDGTFGICEDCGDVIGEKRLEIIPGVELCVNCAEQEEIHLKAYAAV
jgi:DnaK suppressor protein